MNFYQNLAFYIPLIMYSGRCTVAEFILTYTPDQTSISIQMIYNKYWIDQILYNKTYYQKQSSMNETRLNGLTPCTQYTLVIYYAYYNEYGRKSVFPCLENVTTLFGGDSPIKNVTIVQQTMSSITVDLVYDHINCVNSLVVSFNNTNEYIFTKYNITKQFTLKNLLPCVNYALTILSNYGTGQHVVYNRFIRSTPKELEQSNYNYSEIDGQNERDYQVNSFKVPGPVTNLSAYRDSNATITIRWNKPIENPSYVKDYIIKINGKSVCETQNLEYTVHELELCAILHIVVCESANHISCANYTLNSNEYDTNLIQNVSEPTINVDENSATTIHWYARSQDEKCIKHYAVTICDEFQDKKIYYENVKNTRITIPNLILCQTYQLHIETIPIYIWPNIIIQSTFVIKTKPQKPDPPQLISATTYSLKLRSKYLHQNDKCQIKEYKFFCASDNFSAHSKPSANGSGIIKNLKSSNEYKCHAIVRNDIGWSKPSDISLFYTKPWKGRNVLYLYIVNITSRSIGISWQSSPDIVFDIIIEKIKSLDRVSSHCKYIEYEHKYKIQANIANHTFNDLESHTNYSIRAVDVNNNGLQRQDVVVTTLPDVPHHVRNLQIANSTNQSVTIAWELPCTINGKITHFGIQVVEINSSTFEKTLNRSKIPFDEASHQQIFNYTVKRIRPKYQYNITVVILLENFNGPKNRTTIQYKPENYDGKEMVSLKNWGHITIIDYANAVLNINKTLFQLTHFGLKLHILELNCEHDCVRECNFHKVPEVVQIKLNTEIAQVCVPINDSMIELKRGMEYEIKAIIKTTKTDTVTNSIILKISPILRFENNRILYGGITVLFIVVIIVLSMLFARYKKQAHQNDPLQSTYIEIEHFAHFYNHIDDNFIANEYQSIDNMKLAHLPQIDSKNYASKNHYSDIAPYHHNRVVLEPNQFCTTDYINASYINGYKAKNRYIATQGPIEETIYDFWHMVVTTKSEKIVMLPKLRENDVPKCCKYYPNLDESLVLNDLTIKNVAELYFENFIQRAFVITKHGDEKRFVIHYQYLLWPDCDWPATKTFNLIEFIEFIKCSTSKSIHPVIVHCSAGVGTTGIFIALDLLFQIFNHEKYLSICETVRELRMQRCRMVQTSSQYKFLYSTMNIYYQRFIYKHNYFNNISEAVIQ